MWYRLIASDAGALFGWTRIPAVANAALEGINDGLPEIRHYAMDCLGNTPDETGYGGSEGLIPLDCRDDLVFNGDTTLADIEENSALVH